MGKLHYTARKVQGLKAGQVVAKDLRKRIPPGTQAKAAARDRLVDLDISNRKLGDEGMAEVISALLDCLDFSDSNHPEGVIILTDFNLAGNSITTASLRGLAEVIIKSAKYLTDLNLSNNEIAVQGKESAGAWKAFLDSFQQCFTLCTVDFAENPLGLQGFEILARCYVKSELDFVVDVKDVDKETAMQQHSRGIPASPMSTVRARRKTNSSMTCPVYDEESPGNGDSTDLKQPDNEKVIAQFLTEHGSGPSMYPATRGLRSVPYLNFVDTAMDDACALHFVQILTKHRRAHQLRRFLPDIKLLGFLADEDGKKSMFWEPNASLGPRGKKLLGVAQENLHEVSDSEGTEEDTEIESEVEEIERRLSELAVPGQRNTVIGKREKRRKLGIDLDRAKSRLQVEVLKNNGVHSVQLWSIAFKMIVLSRALLLDDSKKVDPGTIDEDEDDDEEIDLASASDNKENVPPEGNECGGYTIPMPARVSANPWAVDDATFEIHFPPVGSPPKEEKVDTTHSRPGNHSDKSPLQDGANHGNASASGSGTGNGTSNSQNHTVQVLTRNRQDIRLFRVEGLDADTKMRFNLPFHLWHRIIVLSMAPAMIHNLLSTRQQKAILSYAADWAMLKHELEITGTQENQQIWRILSDVGCLEYAQDC